MDRLASGRVQGDSFKIALFETICLYGLPCLDFMRFAIGLLSGLNKFCPSDKRIPISQL